MRPPQASARIVCNRSRSADGFWPGFLEPVGRSRRLVGAVAGLRPVGGSRDVANGDGNDSVWIPHRERIVGRVLAEPSHTVFVALVIVRPDIDVAGRGIIAETFKLTDDCLVLGPARCQSVC